MKLVEITSDEIYHDKLVMYKTERGVVCRIVGSMDEVKDVIHVAQCLKDSKLLEYDGYVMQSDSYNVFIRSDWYNDKGKMAIIIYSTVGEEESNDQYEFTDKVELAKVVHGISDPKIRDLVCRDLGLELIDWLFG